MGIIKKAKVKADKIYRSRALKKIKEGFKEESKLINKGFAGYRVKPKRGKFERRVEEFGKRLRREII